MKAVFLDFASIHPDDLDISSLKQITEDWLWLDNTSAADVDSAIKDAELVVTNKVVLNESNLAKASQLKLVCAAATGVNNIDVNAAKKLGIVVSNARAYATPAVVQHVFSLLLSLVTNLDKYRADVTSGQWSQSEFFCLLDHPIRELQGMSLGIVGYGELGQSVATVAKCFGMDVFIAQRDEHDMRAGRLPLKQILKKVDVLSLHCPLTEHTKGMIGENELSLMKNDAIIINTARGGLIDEDALVAALQAKQIAGAALDVIAHEPPPVDSELLMNKPDNLIITPHTAWASRESRQRLVEEIAQNAKAFLQGEARNCVY